MSGIVGSNLGRGSGVVKVAALPDPLPAASGVNLTALNATNLGSGTVADARISESSVTQHVAAVDLTPVTKDISLIALQTAVNGNLSAYGLTNSWIEQFENSTNIENLTNVSRDTSSEYLSSIYSSDTVTIPTSSSDWNGTTSAFSFGSGSVAANGTTGDRCIRSDWETGTGDFTVQCIITAWTQGNFNVFPVANIGSFNPAQGSFNGITASYHMREYDNNIWYGGSSQQSHTFAAGSLVQIKRVSGALDVYDDEVNVTGSAWGTANSTSMYVGLGQEGLPYATNYTSLQFIIPGLADNATGSFESTDITPSDGAAKTSIGLVILYKDEESTACVLDTDIIAQVRANTGQAYDSGSNTLVLRGIDGSTTPAVTYSDGMKVAIAPAITVTSGTALSYKISFANQSSGSKEGRIHGVAMTY